MDFLRNNRHCDSIILPKSRVKSRYGIRREVAKRADILRKLFGYFKCLYRIISIPFFPRRVQ